MCPVYPVASGIPRIPGGGCRWLGTSAVFCVSCGQQERGLVLDTWDVARCILCIHLLGVWCADGIHGIRGRRKKEGRSHCTPLINLIINRSQAYIRPSPSWTARLMPSRSDRLNDPGWGVCLSEWQLNVAIAALMRISFSSSVSAAKARFLAIASSTIWKTSSGSGPPQHLAAL